MKNEGLMYEHGGGNKIRTSFHCILKEEEKEAKVGVCKGKLPSMRRKE